MTRPSLIVAVVFVVQLCLLPAKGSGTGFLQSIRSPYTARLVGGVPRRNVFGDLLGYYIFAEAGAIVTPAPQWAIYLGAQQQAIYEKIPARVASPRRLKKRPVTNQTYSVTQSMTPPHLVSRTIQLQRFTRMSWYTLSHPIGAPPVRGTKTVTADVNDRLSLSDLVFPLPGRYNLLMNVSLYWGPRMTFNVSVTVDPQPGKIVVVQYPQGYNGSFFTTEPQAQLQDLLGNPVRKSTPVVTFSVLSGPANYSVRGTPSVYPDASGLAKLSQVILSLPGKYVVALVAKLTDNTTIQTPSFSLTVQRALPTRIVVIQQATGVTRAVFYTPPVYRIVDQVGFSQDSRTNITLTIGFNSPSVTYRGQDTVGYFSGITSRLQSGFDFVFPGLSINLPGRFEIIASLFLDGELTLQSSYLVTLADLPTFLVPAPVVVNKISVLQVIGFQPQIVPLYLKMSNELACETSASDVAAWNREANTINQVRNVSFVPFVSGRGKYLCLGLPTQTAFVPLLLNYQPAFSEAFPLDYTFSISGVSTCATLTGTDEFLYRTAGWATATAGRSYGCHLSPPVSGTIAPCDCFFALTCATFTDASFTPPGLDIGLCVCCKGWVLVAASVSTIAFFAGLLYVIYAFV